MAKPWQMWSQLHKSFILPLYLLFTVAWSLEMSVPTVLLLLRYMGADGAMVQGYTPRGALLLAVPRQLWLSTAGLVPELVLQDLDCWLPHRHHVHAPRHDLHARGPAQGALLR